MLKRVLPLLLGSLVVLSLCPLSAFADAYTDGVRAYNYKNYARAAQLFQTALSQTANQDNPDAMFYMGMSLTHLNRYDEARKAFEYVLRMVPTNHALAAKSRNNISYLTNQQITMASSSARAKQVMTTSLSNNSKGNYLTHVIPGGKIIHFSTAKMPLRVYIADGLKVPGWNVQMKQAVVSAMRAWSNATRSKVSFSQTYSENNADIIVRWEKNFSDNILGVSPFQSVGDTIIRSDISLAVYYPDSNVPIPYGELVTIATHEMGHAIGLRGHSPYPSDVMYFSSDHASNQALSARDTNTIGMLYKLDADVKNNTAMSTAQTKQYYELYQMGLKAQLGKQAPLAIEYYRKALQLNRNMMEAKFNLGAVLINEGVKMAQAKNLTGAKRNFEEATQLYTELSQAGNGPPETNDNLQLARNNLAYVNAALKQ